MDVLPPSKLGLSGDDHSGSKTKVGQSDTGNDGNRCIRPIKMEMESPNKASASIRVDGPNGLRFNTSLAAGEVTSSPALSLSNRFQQTVNPSKAVFSIEPNTSKILIVNNKACSLLGYSSGELCSMHFSQLLKNRSAKVLNLQGPEYDDSTEDGTIVLLGGKVVELLTKDGGVVHVSLWIRQFNNDGPCLVVAEPVSCKNVVLSIDAESGLIVACDCDDAALLFRAESCDKLVGLPITTLIPSIEIPAYHTPFDNQISKQKATGRTLYGESFPLCMWITKPKNFENASINVNVPEDRPVFDVNVRVIYNVSGLLVVDENGTITACNHHFAMLTFGKPHSEVAGHHIEDVILNFCMEADKVKANESNTVMTLSPIRHENDGAVFTKEDSCGGFDGCQNTDYMLLSVLPSFDTLSTQETSTSAPSISGISGTSKDEENYFLSSISEFRSQNIVRSEQTTVIEKKNIDSFYYSPQHSHDVSPTGSPRVKTNDPSLSFGTPVTEMLSPGCEIEDLSRHKESINIDLETQTESAPRKEYEGNPPESWVAARLLRNLKTSTPQQSFDLTSKSDQCEFTATTDCQHLDGTYRGRALHKDGTELNVMYTVSSMQLTNGSRVHRVWLGVQLENAQSHINLASSLASKADNSPITGDKSVVSSPPHHDEQHLYAGDYSTNFVTIMSIDDAANSCVKMAYRKSDLLLTIVKFILKEKVRFQFWVDGPDGRKMPLEIKILRTLSHPNIVNLIDVFENEKYFQIVMEKCGAGIDLFQFIERRPRLDEPLVSYIFRQIGQAVEYLHSLNILHRDIKDANVIIGNDFHVKLIDFGSATYRRQDELFESFWGTVEYCSPEVLAGIRYAGPELEMWAMGVTLYLLTFFAYPFSDGEETIKGQLTFPHVVSEDLKELLGWMLCKNPTQRCTVPQLMSHPWILQPVTIANYVFHEVLECDPGVVNPAKYYPSTLSIRSRPGSGSPDALVKERSNRSGVAAKARTYP